MTQLRQQMIEDMQLSGLSASTQELYSAAVAQLAKHFHRSPDLLSEQDLRQYFLYLINEKKVSSSTTTRRSMSLSRPASPRAREPNRITRCGLK